MMASGPLRVGLAFALFSAPIPVAAEPAPDPMMAQALSLESLAIDLRPGQYLWRDDQPGLGPVTMIISVPLQRVYAFRELQLIGVATVSTGKPGKSTPRGQFSILQKRQHHRSNLYSNAPMPFMQRLTWTGIALHGGHNPGYPASHGCIRLPMEFARLLFDATAMGADVQVVDDDVVAPPPPEERYIPTLIAMPQALPTPDVVFARGWSRRGGGIQTAAVSLPLPTRGLVVREVRFAAPEAFLRPPSGSE